MTAPNGSGPRAVTWLPFLAILAPLLIGATGFATQTYGDLQQARWELAQLRRELEAHAAQPNHTASTARFERIEERLTRVEERRR